MGSEQSLSTHSGQIINPTNLQKPFSTGVVQGEFLQDRKPPTCTTTKPLTDNIVQEFAFTSI